MHRSATPHGAEWTSRYMDADKLIQEACDLVESREPRLLALVPEPDRRRRLLADVEQQDPSLQPFLVGVKDIINVDDLPTKAGSTLPNELFAGPQATVVTKLQSAGGIVLGKTTTTEFAFSEPPPTTNPHDERHTPGGSSSGSAAAVATGYVPFALGTQTVDSIVTPAAYCGVVGFKPTFGRIPIDGVVPFSTAMDTVGFLARDTETVVFAAKIMLDEWRDMDRTELPVIGLLAPSHFDPVEPTTRAAFDQTISTLTASGCRILQTDMRADMEQIATRHRQLIAAEFATVHREWFNSYSNRYRPRSAALYAEGAALSPSVVEEGKNSSARLRSDLQRTMEDLSIDVWMSPATTGPAPRGLDSIGDPIMGLPWTHAHLPVVCLPSGTSDNDLPLGIQLVGKYRRDEELIGIAHLVELLIKRL